MTGARRVRFQSGRVTLSGPPLPSIVRTPPPSSGPASKSQGAEHGQGLGVGLAILAGGSKPGGRTGGTVAASAPTLVNTVVTAMPGVAGTSYVVTLPTYAAGDIVFVQLSGGVQDFAHNQAACNAAGWTNEYTFWCDNVPHFVMYRVMTGSEGATVTFTMAPSGQQGAVATSYRGVKASGTVEASRPFSTTASGATWTVGPIVPTQAPDMILTFALLDLGQTITSNTYGTQRYASAPSTVPTTCTLYLFDKAELATGSFSNSGTFNGNAASSVVMVGIRATGAA